MILGSLTYNSLLSLRILFSTRNVEELKMIDPSAIAIKENSRMHSSRRYAVELLSSKYYPKIINFSGG